MKKIFLTLAIAITGICACAQNVSIGSDSFSYNGFTVSQYGLGWYSEPTETMAYLTAYGGIKFFTQGAVRGIIDAFGNVGIGTTSPLSALDVRSGNNLLALTNTNLSSSSTAGETSIFFGDTGSGVNMLRASKRTFNTRAFEIWTEYGYNGAYKAADFYHDNINFYTANIDRLSIDVNGNVGIGTPSPDAKLAVNGTIHSREVKVDLTGWPDYVFNSNYSLPALTDVKIYIDQNHHLPEMPSAQEVAKDGINLGEIVKVQTQKIEELTLYLIDLKKENEALKKRQQKIEAQLRSHSIN
jgi:hypothetical protein